MAKWVDIGKLEAFPEAEHRVVSAGPIECVVSNIEGQIYAAHNRCPHMAMPIGTGQLRGCVLTCPFHGFAYDIRTGRNVDFDDTPLRTYPARTTGTGRAEVAVEPNDDDNE